MVWSKLMLTHVVREGGRERGREREIGNGLIYYLIVIANKTALT
jgi:hypothetical protein